MKKQTLAFCCLPLLVLVLLVGCSETPPITQQKQLKKVEQIGQVPDELKTVIENNAFKNVTAFNDRLLKSEVTAADNASRKVCYRIIMMDLYGTEIATYVCETDDAYCVTTLTATEDGGFLFVLGFEDYAYGSKHWASDNGFASRIIKCDRTGQLQFDKALDDIEGQALKHCFEHDDQFFFFGTKETPDSKKQGIVSPTDIYMTIVDKDGTVLKNRTFAGSDYDSLENAEETENGFVLSIQSQSCDGDFYDSNSNGYPIEWVFTVNDELEPVRKQNKSGRDSFDSRLGEQNGKAVYKSVSFLDEFDAGTPTAFIDYGDSYLIISEHNTGIYENKPPEISAIWYYTETVYSAYNKNHELIFRASVDSSPDFDDE